MGIKKEAKEYIKEYGIELVRTQGLIWYFDNIIRRCRTCCKVWNKYRFKENNLNVILERKQYCNSCIKKINDKIGDKYDGV